jgi:polysaccharide biosynthesis protein PslH
MRILYFAPHPLLPANTGSRLRDFYLATELCRYADVTFLEMEQAAPPDAPQREVEAELPFERVLRLQRERAYRPSTIVRGLIGPEPIPLLNYFSPAMATRLVDLLRTVRFDTVQLVSIHLAKFLPALQAAQFPLPIVADWHNVESELMQRYANVTSNPLRKWAARRTAKLLERAEENFLRKCDRHTVTSEREHTQLLARSPGKPIEVIPNGVPVQSIEPRGRSVQRSPNILFVGSLDYHANIDGILWFAGTVWPAVLLKRPDAKLTIVGRQPAAAIEALAGSQIEVIGPVEDVRPFYVDAAVSIVPLRIGGGTRLKIVEAMAAGVPVVSTPLGAEGLQAEDGRHLLLGQTPDELTEAILRIFTNESLADGLALEGRQLVEQHYDWRNIGKRLFTIHEDLADQSKAKR